MPDSSPPLNAPREVLEKVAREYERTLVIPEHKPSPQWMLMPVGLIGSGKTTVVKPLVEHFGLIRISTDEVRERLKKHGYSFEGAREIAHGVTEKYLDLGYSIAVDANTGSVKGFEFNKKTREAFPRVRQLFIHINTPEAFIISNLKNRHKPWIFRDADHAIEQFHFHKNNFTLPGLPFVYTFNLSRGDLPAQLTEGIAVIEDALRHGVVEQET
ncbi:MAG: AAA family ATPase [Patescibacteria group bacterium]